MDFKVAGDESGITAFQARSRGSGECGHIRQVEFANLMAARHSLPPSGLMLQMDIKVEGITLGIMAAALAAAREGRVHILREMQK